MTEEAIAGLDALATRHHTTRVALIEALGILGADSDPTIEQLVAYARQVDRERLSRRPRG